MKPIVGVLLLLSVVIASAAAFVLEDPDFDEYKESLALAEKEQKNENEVETGELQNAPSNSKSNCVTTCTQEYSKVVCVRKFLKICVKRATYKYCSQWRTICSRSQRSEQFVPYQNTDERQQQGKRTTNDEDAVVSSDEEQKAALAAMNSESAKAFRTLYDAKVIKAEKYEVPASKLDDADSKDNALASVVITLDDGRKLQVIQGQELSKENPSTILVAEDMTDIWEVVESKNIQFSTVADYVRAADSSTSPEDAVEKLMALD